ncbi:MAG TPA: phage holin family protein [Candidatus Baltobacteraceae bacterium]|jgi:putative membrane protein
MHLIVRLIINAVAFYLIAMFVPGIHVTSFVAALVAAIIFGLVNAIIRPLVLLITLPLTIVTIGLFAIIVNALMFWLTAVIAPGFKVDGFVPALIGAIIMWIVSIVVSHVIASERAHAV